MEVRHALLAMAHRPGVTMPIPAEISGLGSDEPEYIFVYGMNRDTNQWERPLGNEWILPPDFLTIVETLSANAGRHLALVDFDQRRVWDSHIRTGYLSFGIARSGFQRSVLQKWLPGLDRYRRWYYFGWYP
jgi:hypothetical protein